MAAPHGTLVIVAHPDLGASRVNARWLRELEAHGDGARVHDLYAAYPDGAVDVAAEQALLDAHDTLVLQFPLYWYSCPALLRTWLDEVYQMGWAYGAGGDHMRGKRVAVATSAGDVERNYCAEGSVGFTMEQVLAPFAATCNYVGATWLGHFALYGAEAGLSNECLDRSAADYVKWLRSL